MRPKKPTVWEALNEPVVEISEEQAKNIFLASLVIIGTAWIAPYWGAGNTLGAYQAGAEGTIFEQMADIGTEYGTVAGAFEEYESAPDWYYAAADVSSQVVESIAVGANEVLDISGPVQDLAEFYEPGTTAVWNSWLNLMRDPGTTEF